MLHCPLNYLPLVSGDEVESWADVSVLASS